MPCIARIVSQGDCWQVLAVVNVSDCVCVGLTNVLQQNVMSVCEYLDLNNLNPP